MSKLILGPYIFFDKINYNNAGSAVYTDRLAGLHSLSAYYGTNATTNNIQSGGNSNRERLPTSAYISTNANTGTFSLISESAVATDPSTSAASTTYSYVRSNDFYRGKILAGGPAGTTELRIYTGTKPTSPDVMTNLSTYDSSLLIKFVIPAYAADAAISGFKALSYSQASAMPRYTDTSTFKGASYMLGICPTFTNSTNSADAVATWFWYGNVYGGVTDLSDVPFVIGTVGSTAEADLVIPDTVIKPDTPYKSYGFKFEIPVMYTI